MNFHQQRENSLTAQDATTKLLIAEKLLRQLQTKQTGDLSEFLLLRFYNVFLIVTIYKFEDDFKKILKFLETNNKSTMNLVD